MTIVISKIIQSIKSLEQHFVLSYLYHRFTTDVVITRCLIGESPRLPTPK